MSDTTAYVTIRRLHEQEITLRPFTVSVGKLQPDQGERLQYWRLELNAEADIVIGHGVRELAGDLAAMRKLAATATQAADLLQAALERAGQEDGGA